MRILFIALMTLLPMLAQAQSFRAPGAPQPWYLSVSAIYQDGLSVGGTTLLKYIKTKVEKI